MWVKSQSFSSICPVITLYEINITFYHVHCCQWRLQTCPTLQFTTMDHTERHEQETIASFLIDCDKKWSFNNNFYCLIQRQVLFFVFSWDLLVQTYFWFQDRCQASAWIWPEIRQFYLFKLKFNPNLNSKVD